MLKTIALAMSLWVTPVHHVESMSENFICFSIERMMADFLNNTTGWKKVLHETGKQADEFISWYNQIPPMSRFWANEVIFFSRSNKDFYWVWFAHDGCWLKLFKWSTLLGDIWIIKREREKGVRAND